MVVSFPLFCLEARNSFVLLRLFPFDAFFTVALVVLASIVLDPFSTSYSGAC